LENGLLKQEVARLGKALYDKKGKAKQIQPSQDNTIAVVIKHVEEKIVVCRLCHKEDHKFTNARRRPGRSKRKKPTSKVSNTYINKVDKKTATPYFIKKKRNGKVITIKANKQANKEKRAKHIWMLKEIISTMKSTKKVWVSRGK
jgi:hypothetical protein